MNNIERQVTPLFSIPLYTSNLNISKKEKEYVLNLDYKRVELNNGYMSKNNKILNNKIFNNINSQIKEHLNFYTNEVCKISKNIQFYIIYSWAMKHIKNDKSHKHFHENSLISGVIYFKIPKNSGNITFYKKDSTINEISPLIRLNYSEWGLFNSYKWNLDLKENMIILFPSSLEHSTEKNNSDEERYCISFDTFIKGKIEINNKQLIIN